jgi:hypothetical protein
MRCLSGGCLITWVGILIFGRSRWHSLGFLAGRNPSKRGCRRSPFCVHSLKAISASNWGFTQYTVSLQREDFDEDDRVVNARVG